MTGAMTFSLADLNGMPEPDFVAALGGVFEHAPWVARDAAARRPFATVAALHAAMCAAVEAASPGMRHALLAGHPELAGRAARNGAIAPDSIAEQASAGLDRLSDAEYRRLEALNAAYRARFGIPFILCVKRHGRAALLAAFERRLASDPETESRTAQAEVCRIAAIRLDALVAGEGRLRTTGGISTHVLDTALGRPAEGVAVDLVEIVSATESALVARARTNADGRTDAPLISGRPVPIATYELRFALGDYHRRLGLDLPQPPFLDVVPLRFGVAEPEGHYHVPLAATPWSFQTYRGS
ncbi:2-oxo-4-hydroxy-4-carboxy-5-ureidoimidazoline decarboxylase [Methylobacterium sp. NEAU K]|uniref:2-oxo-4-hydroxy-4-carboxy-5-ureidoimidazoline decarboxylase n=1 Tax=Methylobacterium sp. NEAU K TaxID=3064946 RepID=UPI00273313EC|nr:2-oxo-4-hydroxy-4-carboxy-5-ureidoimidazoline decarboxylase [Methylobacterium sp. NEAU K]MDP4006310.1 2-oxo-4-hydroxy-4-carboxy-5-ureidoimidazoline decarboxylase [Methylobacterium sp. NEAU K]